MKTYTTIITEARKPVWVKIRNIDPNQTTRDGEVDVAWIKKLTKLIKNKKKLPRRAKQAISLSPSPFYKKKPYTAMDGNHRYHARKRAGQKKIKAHISNDVPLHWKGDARKNIVQKVKPRLAQGKSYANVRKSFGEDK